eukprot:9336991-Pyramimonas_sp.AAC.1
MEAAYRDYMDVCLDWAPHRFQQLMRITVEMAPNGLRNMTYDLCQAAWDRTSELRGIVRSTCERLPTGVRPTRLWTQRRAGTNYAPEGVGRRQPCEEMGEIEAFAARKGHIPDGHAALDTACLRGCG